MAETRAENPGPYLSDLLLRATLVFCVFRKYTQSTIWPCNTMAVQRLYDRYDTRWNYLAGGDALVRYALLQYEHVFRRRGPNCYLVNGTRMETGGDEKELMGSPLLQQKWWTRQFYCSQGTGPGQWQIWNILYRKTEGSLNSTLSSISSIFAVVQNGVFTNRLHKF